MKRGCQTGILSLFINVGLIAQKMRRLSYPDKKVAPRQRSRKNNYLCGMEKPEYALSLATAAQELDEYFAGRRETGRPRFYTSIFLTGVFSFEPSGENRVRGKYQLASLLYQLPFNQSLLYSCDI